MTPVFKKDDKSDKNNYRPISILANLSKVYERIKQSQSYPHLNNNFTKYQRGFQKGLSGQHCLIAIIEKWRQSLDFGGQANAVLTALWEAFDCIDCELLIAKLNAYGFDNSNLAFIYSYLFERKQRTKINSSFSCWAEILFGNPMFNLETIFIWRLYMWSFLRDLEYASFANDITPYTCLPEIIHILEKLEKGMQGIFDWCSEN